MICAKFYPMIKNSGEKKKRLERLEKTSQLQGSHFDPELELVSV